MKSFVTLLQREWLQHKWGWIVIVLAPPVLAMLLLQGLSQMHVDIDGHEATVKLARLPAVELAMIAIVGTAGLTFLGAWVTSLIQAPGLARRDQQDRSIEFWLSLPVGHGASVAAPMLAHLLLFPAAALVLGLASSQLVALALVAKVAGPGAWFSLPWGALLAAIAALSLRMLLGLVLATLWLSPLILLTMAASAWLKRWGLPALVAAFVVVGTILDKVYGIPVASESVRALLHQAAHALFNGRAVGGLVVRPGDDPIAALQAVPSWLLSDAAGALAALGSPLLLGALLVSAACFGLLVIRRQRGA